MTKWLPNTEQGNRIAFIGPMGSGKTWAAQYLVDNYGYKKLSFAGKLKQIAKEMFGVEGKDGNDRLILQGLGSDLRKYDEDVWVKYVMKLIHNAGLDYSKIVIDDTRYLNEAGILKENGFILVRLRVPLDELEARLVRLYPNRPATAFLHASETEQEGISADYIILNSEDEGKLELDWLMSEINAKVSSNR